MSGIVGGNAGRSSGSVEPAGVANDSITGAKIADDVVDSEHYVAASIDNEHLADNAVGLAEMAGGTDGNIISYDASGDPVAIATGSDGQVLLQLLKHFLLVGVKFYKFCTLSPPVKLQLVEQLGL